MAEKVVRIPNLAAFLVVLLLVVDSATMALAQRPSIVIRNNIPGGTLEFSCSVGQSQYLTLSNGT